MFLSTSGEAPAYGTTHVPYQVAHQSVTIYRRQSKHIPLLCMANLPDRPQSLHILGNFHSGIL